MVSLTKDGKNVCSGTLISSKFILTAGHCFDRYDPDLFTVVLGNDNLAFQDSYTIERFIDKVYVHPGYEKCCHYFDAALKMNILYLSWVEKVHVMEIQVDPCSHLMMIVQYYLVI